MFSLNGVRFVLWKIEKEPNVDIAITGCIQIIQIFEMNGLVWSKVVRRKRNTPEYLSTKILTFIMGHFLVNTKD